ncbi:hypothetical protein [Polyangium aurulentum]|uniref:hypothetical protein n=1 Tax=Polyangium aurulentum TaxID=2567896 RepID=UPI0010AEA660|nr:hypothetical protein [Polyangium aurulentum]UQA55425.1 hypothetical protein E8A73_029250 [Polyangium aurulentum]
MMRGAALAGVLLLVAGCGPSLGGLIEAKHYREAICAATDGTEGARAEVASALDKDADLQVHVHVVTAEELQPVLGSATEKVIERGRLARVMVDSNVLPVDTLEIEASFVTDGGFVAGLDAGWEALAWVTQEKLPGRHREETYATPGNLLRGGAAVLTLGLSLLFTDFQPGMVEVDAPPSEFARMAPLATRLRATTERGGCKSAAMPAPSSAAGAGQRCTFYFVLDNVSRMPVLLELKARYAATRHNAESLAYTHRECAVERTFRVPLGPPAGIEEAARRKFGTRMRAVGEVAAR